MALFTGQAKIAATNMRVQIAPLVNVNLQNGLLLKAKAANNAAGILIGSGDVTNTYDGTGNGFPILPGETMSVPSGERADALWFQGTTGDVVSYEGN